MDAQTNYEAEYNNRARVSDAAAIIDGWQELAADWRSKTHKAEIGLSYGDGARNVVDIFTPDYERAGPIALFIHGGYWQALGKDWFSHMARGPNLNGLTVAVPSYDLCPNVTVMQIVEQMRECCLWLWRRYKRRIVIFGHSAGGHLTACMLATDWLSLDPDAPSLLAGAGLAISGLFDLQPLVGTSINENLLLNQQTAQEASPIFWKPPSGLRLVAAVGGTESDEYLRQSRDFTAHWHEQGMAALPRVIDGENHFTVIANLAEPDGVLTRTLTGLASTAT
ncbi:MAG: alpha/beta hydrolase [Hyphomicrobiales bacterium]